MRAHGLGSYRHFADAALLAAALAVGCGSSTSGGAMPGPGSADAATPSDGNGTSNAGPLALITDPFGFATQYLDPQSGQTKVVTGGASAPTTNIYVVHNRKELLDALSNVNSPTFASDALAAKKEPKIIYIVGTIRGNELPDGSLADANTY